LHLLARRVGGWRWDRWVESQEQGRRDLLRTGEESEVVGVTSSTAATPTAGHCQSYHLPNSAPHYLTYHQKFQQQHQLLHELRHEHDPRFIHFKLPPCAGRGVVGPSLSQCFRQVICFRPMTYEEL